ncbi:MULTISPECIES: RecQ family ATP-dependent DNA helicase [Sporosarcina]|uniref:RecQ family ATP-dependent DNA helicase n=1 Tax=Sporosarcina TaxID=1569 RepID=UPI00058CCF73|nr:MULTISPECIES: ATP-dependent DNA helicase RecQ [Sporosarcina]WJY28615.1 ATP-dependent DNA helicase RecQ [Sporosarcina sp. 0.2-SM1T-5]
MNLHDELKRRFGFDRFRPGQKEVIGAVLDGRDTLAILPTGMGKSLCYQLPGDLLDGLVIIVSPLVSLMEDQAASIRKRGEKRVAAVNSMMAAEQRKQLFAEIRQIKFLFISPEMMNRPDMTRLLASQPVALLVIDEAHCISQWGFDFRPDYLKIGEFIRKAGNPRILALTATADQRVEQDILTYLNMQDASVIRQSVNRPNIYYSLRRFDSIPEKNDWIAGRLKATSGPGVLYVASRKRSEELTQLLQKEGIQIAAYHAGKEAGDRQMIQQQFLSGELDWICATNAFGMGIHKDDIRQVIHDQMPASAAAYVQEAGRAGRDGKQSSAVLLSLPDDGQKIRFIVQNDLPDDTEVTYYARLRKAGNQREQAAELAGISETGARLIDHYAEQENEAGIADIFTGLRFGKEEKLRQMMDYTTGNTCLRTKLLYYFGEQPPEQQDVCCSACGDPPEDWLGKQHAVLNERRLLPWEDRIRLLLC